MGLLNGLGFEVVGIVFLMGFLGVSYLFLQSCQPVSLLVSDLQKTLDCVIGALLLLLFSLPGPG